jgi:NAD-dependent SIR2 family protein deacetylase
VYTQNIDGLELMAGLPAEKVVQCHGTFDTASCIDCKGPASSDEFLRGAVAGVPERCKACGGMVKPDIVFFGEPLPDAFDASLDDDLARCDLLVVVGTRCASF